MKPQNAMLACLLLAAAAAFVAFRFFEPVPFAISPLPELASAAVAGHFYTALLVGFGTYGATAAALLSGALVVELLHAMARLRMAGSTSDGYLKCRDWEAAFSHASIEPLQYRLIARNFTLDDDRLVLAAPFWPSIARGELRGFYARRVALAQVWTVAVALLAVLIVPVLGLLRPETALFLGHGAAIESGFILGAYALGWLAVATASDALISAIARLPLMVDSTLRAQSLSALLGSGSTAITRLANATASALRAEAQAMLSGLEEAAARTLMSDEKLLERLAENVAGAVFASVDARLSASLQHFDKLATASDLFRRELSALRTELIDGLAALPESFARQYAAEVAESTSAVTAAAAAERRAIADGLEALQRSVLASAQDQIEELRRLGSDTRASATQLKECVESVSSLGDHTKQAGLAKANELMHMFEAYTASLLPAVKRLEGCEEQVATALVNQSELLSQLGRSLKELSGTLEAVRVTFTQTGGQRPLVGPSPEGLESNGPESEGLAVGDDDRGRVSLSAQLRSLLEDLEDGSSR